MLVLLPLSAVVSTNLSKLGMIHVLRSFLELYVLVYLYVRANISFPVC